GVPAEAFQQAAGPGARRQQVLAGVEQPPRRPHGRDALALAVEGVNGTTGVEADALEAAPGEQGLDVPRIAHLGHRRKEEGGARARSIGGAGGMMPAPAQEDSWPRSPLSRTSTRTPPRARK